MSFFVYLVKDLANCWTDMVLLYSYASYRGVTTSNRKKSLIYEDFYTLSPQEYTPSKYATSKKSNIHVVPTTDLLNTILPN